MPQMDDAPIEIVAFEWVPPFARGRVRDLRARWALEEIGLPYRIRLISAVERPAPYFAEQPFGQVPAYHEGDAHLFESGAIVLHIAEKDERLMPRDPAGRASTLSWMFAALNNIEPPLWELVNVDLFSAGEDWAPLRRPSLVAFVERRLERLAAALDDRPWLAGRFTAADILMADVLRNLPGDGVSVPQVLRDYVARAMARPAFQAARAAQIADFIPDERYEKKGVLA